MKLRRSLIFVATLLLVLSVGNAANEFYSHTSGVPSTGSQGSSSTMRAEFDSIVAGFDKLPTMTANGNLPVFVNSGGTALSAISAASARTNLGVSATGADTTYAFRANNLSDLASAATARTNLGLGTISTQAANSVSITGGSISGITDLAVADGGTGSSTASGARTNLGAAASGANSDITSLTGITGNVTSTKACAGGYARVGPNFCAKTSVYSFTALTRDVCATLTSPAGDAKALLIYYAVLASTGNSVAQRVTQLYFYGDATCTTAQGFTTAMGWEFNATTPGNPISEDSGHFILVNPSATNYSAKFIDDAGNQGSASYEIRGYFD